MAEYIVQKESLTAIADEIRILSDTTEPMGLDAMATHVGEANNEISTQATLLSEQDAKIAELAEVLAGKAGGSGSSVKIETCTVTINYTNTDFGGIGSVPNSIIYFSTINSDGIIQNATMQGGKDFDFSDGMWGSISGSVTIDNVVKNSILTIHDNSLGVIVQNDVVQLHLDTDGEYSPRVFLINQSGIINIS